MAVLRFGAGQRVVYKPRPLAVHRHFNDVVGWLNERLPGLGLRRLTFENSDRATWSPAPRNEIAYTARTGPGYDIKVYDLATSETRQLTFGEGSNEAPAWSANGRHLAFWSSRSGRAQIFTVDYDGKNIRQLTRDGNNQQPHWSQ